MAKLAVLAAALLLLLAISNATIYQTTIIGGDDDGGSEFEQFQMSQRCREQIQSQQFWQCGQFLKEQQGRPGDVLILRGIRNQQRQESLRQCCQAMQNMDQQCQCTGLRQLVDKVQQEQEQGQEQEQEQGQRQLMQIARQLPERCGTGRACRNMKVVWY